MRAVLVVATMLVGQAAWAAVCPGYDQNLRGNVGLIVGSGNTCAFSNDNTASCGGAAMSPDYTFLWTPTRTGTYEINASGSSYDTVLHVRNSQSCAEIVCNDDFYGLQSKVEISAVSGVDYLIVMDGYNTNSCGDFELNIQPLNLAPTYTPTLALENTFGFCPGQEEFVLFDATPNGRIALITGSGAGDGSATRGGCTGTTFPFLNPRVLAIRRADANGDATFSGVTSLNQCGTQWLVAMDLTTCETSNINTP